MTDEVPIRRIPEAPRDDSLSINAPRRVRFDREVYRDSQGRPEAWGTWITVDDAPARKTGGDR